MLDKPHARAGIIPIVRTEFTHEDLKFTTACFGGTETTWSLGPLQKAEDSQGNDELVAKIRGAMQGLRADRVYAPSPTTFNGVIVQPEALTKRIALGQGVLMFRNAEAPADGTYLRSPSDAGVFSAGGCGLIVASLGSKLIFAHAGRDCVINRKRVLGKPDARQFESVVNSIVDELCRGGESPSSIRAWVLYSIKPEDFDHPYVIEARENETPAEELTRRENMLYNKNVWPHLSSQGLGLGAQLLPHCINIDVPQIARLQFMQLGVPAQYINMEHCYLSDELPHTRKGDSKARRYLVAVVRQS